MNKISFMFCAICLAFTHSARADNHEFASEEDKFSYSLGLLIGERVLGQYENLNYELVLEAMKAQHSGAETRVSLEDANGIIQAHHMQQQQWPHWLTTLTTSPCA